MNEWAQAFMFILGLVVSIVGYGVDRLIKKVDAIGKDVENLKNRVIVREVMVDRRDSERRQAAVEFHGMDQRHAERRRV